MAHLPRLSMRGVLGPEQGPAAPGDRAWLTETPMNRLAAYSIIAAVGGGASEDERVVGMRVEVAEVIPKQ